MMPVRMIQIQPWGGKGFWMRRTMKGTRKMTVAATRAWKKKRELPRLCLAIRFQLACRNRGDEDKG